MHWLSTHNRSEFLACPQLVRFDYAKGRDGFEPTLLIKGSTLLLKYVVLGAPMKLAFAKFEGRLICALKVCDDGEEGGILWSVVEREEELNGIRGLSRGEPPVALLFNELALNVAWNDLSITGAINGLSTLVENTELGHFDHAGIEELLFPFLEKLHLNVEHASNWLVLEIGGNGDWKPIKNHFIMATASSSLIDIFDMDEGNQQEQIGLWLTDNLQPSGAFHRPQRPYKANETRELIDILLSHEFGATFIESKTLAILARQQLPDRAKLKRDVSADLSKGFSQLRGAIRKLKDGVEITSRSGKVLSIERNQPAHAIVLVPDLELVDNESEYCLDFIKKFMRDTGGFAHILDISELLRVVQAAKMIASRGMTLTPMMAFDY